MCEGRLAHPRDAAFGQRMLEREEVYARQVRARDGAHAAAREERACQFEPEIIRRHRLRCGAIWKFKVHKKSMRVFGRSSKPITRASQLHPDSTAHSPSSCRRRVR